jgi:CBS domain-containing protein
MTTDVVAIGPERTVHDVACLLSENKISAVPVVENGKVVGMVSEGDLIRHEELGTAMTVSRRSGAGANVDDSKSHGTLVRDVMTRHVYTISEASPLAEVAEIMQTNHIKRVPVMRAAKLVGIVSRSDIVRTLAARPEGAHEPLGSDDDIIRFKVIEILMDMPGTSPWLTTVTVTDGVVELRGAVQDETQREPSRATIARLPEVVDVKDHRAILQPY